MSNETNSLMIEEEAQGEQQKFETSAEAVVKDGLDLMEKNHGSNSESPKEFHDVGHPTRMIERSKPLKEVLNIGEHGGKIIDMAIAYHDSIIEFDPAPNGV